MPQENPLIAVLVIGLGMAFFLGTLADRLKISLLVGYLLAGVVVGPFTPGFVANQGLVLQLAEVGVILLMFGVGLHFSVADLAAVRAVAIPGALLQVVLTTALGTGLGWALGMTPGSSLLFGMALSVASTVVLLRALQERRLVETQRGHMAVGWLVIQDIVTVLALVLLPIMAPLLKNDAAALPGWSELALTIATTVGKVIAFVGLMLVIGRKVIPMALHYVAHTGSRELFRLAVLAVALGVAFWSAEMFGVSFALGAFIAGMVLSESELSQRAAEETLPLRDAFAVLFFISVGMLFDPTILWRDPLPLLETLAVVMIGTPLITFLILRSFRRSWNMALTLAVGVGQIGEFSFILAALGIELGLLDEHARDLILGVSILSILLNPLLFTAVKRLKPWIERRDAARLVATGVPAQVATPAVPTTLTGHAVIVGYGRVGSLVVDGLLLEGWNVVVLETGDAAAQSLRPRGIEVFVGNAADPVMLELVNIKAAKLLVVAIPDAFEAGQIVQQARAANPAIDIIARAHFDSAVEHLAQHGATSVVMGEREIARAMIDYAERDRPAVRTEPLEDATAS